ncbi:uncharacterized protein LOC116349476 [Contarinia nasturtii]|uniref:uncharacterized protein LOC116349476 n=1 Tax=Contarinia nasturtii TaxID=265458 RepID=UPI0012D3BA85|nr:uncharacterized protein LOC116349476 [Contarinia nasturtii]
MKRIIIDCDPGNGVAGANVDDGLALALAIASLNITLELITIVAGNTPATVGYRVAHNLVKRLGLSIPVRMGATKGLKEPLEQWREVLDHNVDHLNLTHLWHGVPQPPNVTPPETEENAIDAIGRLILNNPGEITLIGIGPLTNIAMAIQRYPKLVESVAEIAIMGGVFNVDNYLKDTNFGIDPEAAKIVLNSGANITIVPMDVTTQTMLTHESLERITKIDKPLTRYIYETTRPWIDYSMKTRNLPGSWIHDALVVASLIDPRVATTKEYRMDIELRDGPTRGKCWRYCNPLRVSVGIDGSAGALVNMLQSVDNQHLLNMIQQAFDASTI